ncbi:MAG: class I SAM-dependent methyltransferase [Synergistaceae bacterium]|nr:class I SAM-dependent methyltransferase [Synergistaceae bacterium]
MTRKIMGWLIRELRKPSGFLAPFLISSMNLGHSRFTRKVLGEVSITSSDKILDIGCGGGNAISIMAESCGAVYGIDPSPSCVKKSTDKNRNGVKTNRVVIREGDAEAIPFGDGTFDLITAFETVYFWPDVESAFMEIHRKLKPSGIFLVACETRRPESGEKHLLEDIDTGNGTFRIFGRGEMRDILSAAGFVDIKELLPREDRWLCMSAQKMSAL